MKPSNWNQLPKEEKAKIAVSLFHTSRGGYIIGQALTRAIETMKLEKHPEQSNIEDMEMLGEMIFRIGYTLTQLARAGVVMPKPNAPREKKKHVRSTLIK